MINKIKTISDKALFNSIMNDYFLHKKAYVKSSSGNIQVKFLNCSGGLAAVRIPFNVSPPQNSLIFTRNNDNVIFAYMKFWEARDADTFIFEPAKFQIIKAVRKNERKSIGASEDNGLIFATNIITEYLIRNSLSNKKEATDKMKKRIIYDNEKDYEYIKLFFEDNEIDDPRMNYFHDKREPLFIPYIKNGLTDMKDEKTAHYMDAIYTSDRDLIENSRLVSEAAVPFLYDSKIPYGYIQVNGSAPFTNGTLQAVKRTASLVERMGKDYKLFTELDDMVVVTDISTKGLGIVFKEKKYIPYYKEKSCVSLDLILPNDNNASMLARVRHLEMLEDKFIKAGLEIVKMDKNSIINYESFIKSYGNAA